MPKCKAIVFMVWQQWGWKEEGVGCLYVGSKAVVIKGIGLIAMGWVMVRCGDVAGASSNCWTRFFLC